MDPYYDPSGAAAYVALMLVLIPIILIFALAFYIIYAVFAMKVFEKAGVEGKWRAWVPVYNGMVMGKLGDVSPWVVLGAAIAAGVLGQIPFVGWIFSILSIVVVVGYSWRVGLKFGKEWYLLLLWLIPGVGTLIWLGILAFGSARWNPNVPAAPWANTFIADKTVWTGIPVQPGAAPAGPAAGYAPPAPGYTQPPAPGYAPPAAPATPPAATTPPPAQPPVPPTEPPAAPPVDPNEPPKA